MTVMCGCASASRSSQTSATYATKPSVATPSSPTPTQTTNRPLDELLLFFPARHPVGNWQPDSLIFEDVWFQAADGAKLHGWYCPCDKPKAVILYAHGNAGNITHRQSRLKQLQKDQQVTTFIFDYRGYGRSEGSPTVAGVLKDARAARKYLAEKAKVKESEVVLLGESLGGAVVVNLAGEDGAKGLILENTFSSLKEVAEHHYPKLAWMVPAGKLDSVALLKKYSGPVLQCHGDVDQVIPYSLGVKLHEAAPGPKTFVKLSGHDHNDPLPREYQQKLSDFLTTLVKQQ